MSLHNKGQTIVSYGKSSPFKNQSPIRAYREVIPAANTERNPMKLHYDIFYGTFLRRPNRFIAYVDLSGTEVICHVPNTGRLKELLVPGAQVMLSHHGSELRKTQYELRMVKKEGSWVSIDSQLPNLLAQEAIVNQVVEELTGYSELQREVVYQNSRFDLRLARPEKDSAVETKAPICYVEVKGVTLERDGWSYFPDAPTERGRKHIDELIHAVQNGNQAALLFVIQTEKAQGFSPNGITDPAFAGKVKAAYEAGVEILAYRCQVSPQEVTLLHKLPVIL
jgi:sugar fermentation stimulation protein A